MCLYLEFCQKQDCKMYHPHMGAPHEYIAFMGINRSLLPRKEWEMKKCVHQGAKALIADKERLRQHFYRTSVCPNQHNCKEKETCQNAHFSDEFRLPFCLFLNFCDDKNCKYFHPERDIKEKFIPYFKYSSSEFKKRKETLSNLLPLREPNPLAVPSPCMAKKQKTKLCAFVLKQMCNKPGCTFAHTLEELNVGREFQSLQEKKMFVEQKTGVQVSDVYLRQGFENSIDRKMEQEHLEFVMKMREEDDDDKYDDDDEEETEELRVIIDMKQAEMQMQEDSEIREILREIEIDQHKEQFLEDMEMMEMEEFDDEIVVETFFYNQK